MKWKVVPFRDLRSGEKVVAAIRRHWWVLFRETFALAILFLLPFIVIPLFINAATQGAAISIPPGVGIFFGALWTLIIWNIFFVRWTDYYYDLWIITSQRIIDIEQRALFHRDVATMFNLNHIEDVKTLLVGVFGNLLGFGQIQVQTAASKDEFVMQDITDPVGVERLIRETQRTYYDETGRPRQNK